MSLLDDLAESRIVQAQDRGEFDDLPGAGRPLCIDDDGLIAAEWRMAHRVLRNAGHLPREVSLRKEAAELEAFIATLTGCCERQLAWGRLEALQLAISASRGQRSLWLEEAEYRERVVERLER